MDMSFMLHVQECILAEPSGSPHVHWVHCKNLHKLTIF